MARAVLRPWKSSGRCSRLSMSIVKFVFIDRMEFDALATLCDKIFYIERIEKKVLHTSIGKILSHFVAAFVSCARICR